MVRSHNTRCAQALALALGLAGCAAAVRSDDAATSAADSGPMPACPRAPFDAGGAYPDAPIEGRDAVRAAPVLATAQVTSAVDECSGAGGMHFTLRVAQAGCGRAVASAMMGGHAYYPMPALAEGAWLVVGLDPDMPASADARSEPGWCLTGLPAVESTVLAFVRATGEADANAQLAMLLR